VRSIRTGEWRGRWHGFPTASSLVPRGLATCTRCARPAPAGAPHQERLGVAAVGGSARESRSFRRAIRTLRAQAPEGGRASDHHRRARSIRCTIGAGPCRDRPRQEDEQQPTRMRECPNSCRLALAVPIKLVTEKRAMKSRMAIITEGKKKISGRSWLASFLLMCLVSTWAAFSCADAPHRTGPLHWRP